VFAKPLESLVFMMLLLCCSLACAFVLYLANHLLGRHQTKPLHFGCRPVSNNALLSQRVPKNQRKPDWVRNELIRLAAVSRGSRRSVARLFNRLYGERYGETVSVSFTCDFLKRHAVQVLRLRRELAAKPPRAVPICHTWAMDLTFFTDDAKQTHANIGIIDHGARALLCLRTLTIRNSWTLLGYLCLTIGRYGKPRKLRSDNEAIMNSWVFKTFLKLVGIQKQTTNVHSPWQNGRIERLFGTLKPVLRQLQIVGMTQLQAALDEFKTFYNHARPHTNLNNQTPAQVWQSQCHKPKQRRKPKPKLVIVQAFDGLMTGVYEPPD
jgi:transposase InsO family protein